MFLCTTRCTNTCGVVVNDLHTRIRLAWSVRHPNSRNGIKLLEHRGYEIDIPGNSRSKFDPGRIGTKPFHFPVCTSAAHGKWFRVLCFLSFFFFLSFSINKKGNGEPLLAIFASFTLTRALPKTCIWQSLSETTGLVHVPYVFIIVVLVLKQLWQSLLPRVNYFSSDISRLTTDSYFSYIFSSIGQTSRWRL